jgi:hypothetical protein
MIGKFLSRETFENNIQPAVMFALRYVSSLGTAIDGDVQIPKKPPTFLSGAAEVQPPSFLLSNSLL